jgi:pimeloyl-ACP methyl ester carboxylesterase
VRRLRRIASTALGAGLALWLASTVRRVARRRARIEWSPPLSTNHHGTLAARILGSAGRPVVLVHGLTASNRYWGATFDALAAQHRLVVPDLLGFGASPRPPTGYGPKDHADAVAALLHEVGADDQPALVVGHSTGCLIALHLAAIAPELVGGVLAFAPPLYATRDDAKVHVQRLGVMARILALDTTAARALCAWVCEHRDLAGRFSVLVRPDLPPAIARDGVQHTWASYSETLERVILAADSGGVMDAVGVPVRFVLGEDDPVPDRALLERLARDNPHASLAVWPDSDHDLLLTSPDRVLGEIRRALARALDDATHV